MPASSTTRADAADRNHWPNAAGVVRMQASSWISPSPSRTHIWLNLSPTSTPMVRQTGDFALLARSSILPFWIHQNPFPVWISDYRQAAVLLIPSKNGS